MLYSMAFSPDSELLAIGLEYTGPRPWAVELWNTTGGWPWTLQQTLLDEPLSTSITRALTFAPDSMTLAVAHQANDGFEPNVKLFSSTGGSIWTLQRTLPDSTSYYRRWPHGDGLAFSNDGAYFATSAGSPNGPNVWSTSDWTLQTLNGSLEITTAVAFSPDSTLLAAGVKEKYGESSRVTCGA